MSLTAKSTEHLMNKIISRANDIGMRVNNKKTHILCFGPQNGFDIDVSITLGDSEVIKSEDELRLLGFYFSGEPNASRHVQEIKKKFRARYWSLVHLRRANIKGQHLFRLYTLFVRPVIEFCSIVYHSLLTKQQDLELERLQRKVIRLCFGYNCDVESVGKREGIETLSERRVCSVDRFIVKNYMNERFSSKWFPRKQHIRHDIRKQKKFEEFKTNTDRFYNSPLNYMRRRINFLHDNDMLEQRNIPQIVGVNQQQ